MFYLYSDVFLCSDCADTYIHCSTILPYLCMYTHTHATYYGNKLVIIIIILQYVLPYFNNKIWLRLTCVFRSMYTWFSCIICLSFIYLFTNRLAHSHAHSARERERLVDICLRITKTIISHLILFFLIITMWIFFVFK